MAIILSEEDLEELANILRSRKISFSRPATSTPPTELQKKDRGQSVSLLDTFKAWIESIKHRLGGER